MSLLLPLLKSIIAPVLGLALNTAYTKADKNGTELDHTLPLTFESISAADLMVSIGVTDFEVIIADSVANQNVTYIVSRDATGDNSSKFTGVRKL